MFILTNEDETIPRIFMSKEENVFSFNHFLTLTINTQTHRRARTHTHAHIHVPLHTHKHKRAHTPRLGRLQDQSNRLRLLENAMITITFILNVIDYDQDFTVYSTNMYMILHQYSLRHILWCDIEIKIVQQMLTLLISFNLSEINIHKGCICQCLHTYL